MNPKQMALSRLARLALDSVSDSSPAERAATCMLVATALHHDCPGLAELARNAASKFYAATEAEEDLLTNLPEP